MSPRWDPHTSRDEIMGRPVGPRHLFSQFIAERPDVHAIGRGLAAIGEAKPMAGAAHGGAGRRDRVGAHLGVGEGIGDQLIGAHALVLALDLPHGAGVAALFHPGGRAQMQHHGVMLLLRVMLWLRKGGQGGEAGAEKTGRAGGGEAEGACHGVGYLLDSVLLRDDLWRGWDEICLPFGQARPCRATRRLVPAIGLGLRVLLLLIYRLRRGEGGAWASRRSPGTV